MHMIFTVCIFSGLMYYILNAQMSLCPEQINMHNEPSTGVTFVCQVKSVIQEATVTGVELHSIEDVIHIECADGQSMLT